MQWNPTVIFFFQAKRFNRLATVEMIRLVNFCLL